MHIAAHLYGRINAHTRQARHLLAEKGSSKWSPGDQSAFDRHIEEVERAQAELDKLSAHQDAFEIFLRKDAAAMSAAERHAVLNTMSTSTGSQGGYTVQSEIAAQLVNMLRGWGWMRAVASQMTTASGADMSVPTSDGTTEVGELLGQNVTAALLDPSFGTAPIPTYRFSSKIFGVPFELLQDSSVDIAAFLMLRARDRIGRIQNTKFTIGTGTGEPTGLVTAATIGKTGTTGQTTTIIYDDLVDLAESVDDALLGMPDKTPGAPQPVVGWTCSSAMRKVLRKMKDTAGRPIFLDAGIEIDGKTYAEMLGYPVYINNDVPVPAANAKSLLFGNLSSYMIRDALDVTMFRFEDSAFTKLGQVGFLAYARAGGNLLDAGAAKAYQHSAT